MDISIIVPVYNCETYLVQCLESIQQCNQFSMECILVNDGSTDNSLAICQKFQEKDSRFRVINKENEGVSVARNTGLQQATGTYIVFQDADDIFTTDAFFIMEKAVKHPEIQMQVFSSITLFEDGREKREKFSFDAEECGDMTVARELMYASSQFNSCWGKLFLREVIEAYSIKFPEDLSIGEDYVFVAEYFRHCESVYISQQPILYYRQHEKSAMKRFTMSERLEYTDILYGYNKRAVEELKDPILLQKMYNYYIRVLTNLFLSFSKGTSIPCLAVEYKKAFQIPCVKEFVENASTKELPSYKKIECGMLKKQLFYLMAVYFKVKSVM